MKTTPWFDGSQKPVRVGAYGRRFQSGTKFGFSWWDGRGWGFAGQTPECAYLLRKARSCLDELQWRGLAHKGKG